MPYRRGLERRRRDEREQPRHLREHSVVAWSASSTSARAAGETERELGRPRLLAARAARRRRCGSRPRSARAPPRCADASAGRAARARRARRAPSTTTQARRCARRASSTRPADRSPRTPRRRGTGSRAACPEAACSSHAIVGEARRLAPISIPLQRPCSRRELRRESGGHARRRGSARARSA